MKKKLRKIVIDDKVYFWSRKLTVIRHQDSGELSSFSYIVKVLVLLDGNNKSPLKINFESGPEQQKWMMLWDDGVFVKQTTLGKNDKGQHIIKAQSINLNRPAVIATLIRHFLKNGWHPSQGNKELFIKDGLLLFDEINLPIDIAEFVRD